MFEIVNKDLGQSVLIENKPGARGTQAALFLVNQAQPDGYTLAHHHLSILRHPFLTKQKTWDPIADFTYVMQVSGFLFGTAVRADSPYKTFRDLIEAARKAPGRLTYLDQRHRHHQPPGDGGDLRPRGRGDDPYPLSRLAGGCDGAARQADRRGGGQLLLAAECRGGGAASALGLDAGESWRPSPACRPCATSATTWW